MRPRERSDEAEVHLLRRALLAAADVAGAPGRLRHIKARHVDAGGAGAIGTGPPASYAREGARLRPRVACPCRSRTEGDGVGGHTLSLWRRTPVKPRASSSRRARICPAETKTKVPRCGRTAPRALARLK